MTEFLTEILGRKIIYRRLSADEYREKFIGLGLGPEYADNLVKVELEVARGVEESILNANEDKKIVGKHTLREYLEANRDIWAKQ